MIYQDIFNRKFYVLNVLLIIGLVCVTFQEITITFWREQLKVKQKASPMTTM